MTDEATGLRGEGFAEDNIKSDIYLDASYTRVIEMWGAAAEKLIASKIKNTAGANHDLHDGHGYSDRLESGGSYNGLTQSCCRSKQPQKASPR